MESRQDEGRGQIPDFFYLCGARLPADDESKRARKENQARRSYVACAGRLVAQRSNEEKGMVEWW